MLKTWVIIGIFAAVANSLFNIYQKKTVSNNQTPIQVALNMHIIGAVLLSPVVAIFDINIQTDVILILIFSGLLNALSFVLLAKAYNSQSISIVAPLRGVTPIAIAVIEPIFNRSIQYSISLLGASVLVACGIYILLYKDSLYEPIKRIKDKGVQFGVGSALIISIAAVADKKAIEITEVKPIVYALYLLFVTSLFITSYILLKKENLSDKIVLDRDSCIVGTLRAVVISLVFISISLAAATKINILLQSGTVIAVVLGGRLFEESDLLLKSAGAVLILIACVIVIT